MPTENRSSNTEMVSVPRDVAENAWQALDDDGRFEESCPLREALDRPTQLRQGEPVALPARREVKLPADGENTDARSFERGWLRGWNACLDEIAKLGPLYSRPAQDEPVAWQDPDNDSRMCTAEHKAYALSKGGAPAAALSSLTRPLYTHADPGEVERLSLELSAVKYNLDKTDKGLLAADAEVRRLRKTIAGMNEAHAKVVESNANLRAQLADLKRRHDGLHRDMATIAGREVPKGCTVADYAAAAIADALSASAEPTYPRVEIVRAHKHTCASCKEGAEHAPCDCGAIVDGVAVKIEPSAALERKP